ncbi:hypothetical protein [Thiomicrorhabdus chilensis]|uniref:hypothetical protein n=1 Tax=Thiomicrorhabdus chilensis TaxID=63656 RepID=UPI00040321F8|nr:hypothetical protein [Thiomicrorhabdus chilensis]
MQIRTLKASFERIITDEAGLTTATKEFLDGLKLQTVKYSRPASELINDAPDFSVLDSEKLKASAAFYAGLAEHIAEICEVETPEWTKNESLVLDEPLFWMNTPRVRQLMLVETPVYYRNRNIFCGKIFGALNTPVPVPEKSDMSFTGC